MPKKVPQRRNKNAGKSTGKSKSAKYFAKNPDKRAAKNRYNTEKQSTPEQKKKRAARNKARKDLGLKRGSNMDASHTKSGRVVKEHRSKNRARNGRGGTAKRK